MARTGEPQNHMFGEMRAALDISKGTDILDHIYSLPTADQAAAHAKIQAIERRAMDQQVPQAGLVTLMEYLDSKGLRKGICTRNFDTPVTHLLETYLPGHVGGKPNGFAPIVTREFRPPKPSPRGIWFIATNWGVVGEAEVSEMEEANQSGTKREMKLPLIMVGDSVDDIAAGYDAGAATVLLKSPGKEELEKDRRTDVVISR